MSILKEMTERVGSWATRAYEFIDKWLTPGTWLELIFGKIPEDYKPPVRTQLLFFWVAFSVFVLASVGLALQVAAAAGAVGAFPIHFSVWAILSVVASSIADPHFQVFHAEMPFVQLLTSLTFLIMTLSSAHQSLDHLARKRPGAVIETLFFGAKRAWSALKSVKDFLKNQRSRVDTPLI